jgi:transposase-like protein
MARKRALPTPQELDLPVIMARFSTEDQARTYLESVRWENGRYCPHCGNADEARIYPITANPAKKVRAGLYDCGECRLSFTVTVGSIFESTKIPLNKWLIAYFLLCGSKKGVSALQIQRHLAIGSYRTAWFMMHRIRYAMRDAIETEPLTGTVEVDETYVGGRRRNTPRGRPGPESHKAPVVALVQRGGKVRSMHMARVTGANLKAVLRQHVDPKATLMTDEYRIYRKPGREFAKHETVNHGAGEYVRGSAHVNTAEWFFSLLKRGINGIYHHVSKQHLGQYLGEFDFRYNTREMTDGARTIEGIRKIAGKRLVLRRPTTKQQDPIL